MDADLQEQIADGYARLELDAIARMRESFDLCAAQWVGNKDDDPGDWIPMGVGAEATREIGFCNEQELTQARQTCRTFARENPFAINAIENRISYVVGTGHVYKPAAIKGKTVSDQELADFQAVLDEFIEANDWHCRQQEIRRRLDRDGEVFLRLFDQPDGTTLVRFVEPGQVYQPHDKTEVNYSFGIETDPQDVENVLAYWVDGERIEAGQIQHRKANVDATCKRGIPTLWAVRRNLDRAVKLLRNMSVVAAIQAAIAMIRRHGNASNSQVSAFAATGVAATRVNPMTNQVDRLKRDQGPRIIDANANTDYEFPAAGTNAANTVGVLQAELRAIAARLVMPEFMLSSDASNGNYASTLVAEGPAVKSFERLQAETVEEDNEILRRVIDRAIEAKRLPADIMERAYIDVTRPTVVSTDRLKDAQANKIEHDSGVLSSKTWAALRGYDWDVEEANFAAERQVAVEHAQALMPPPDPGADQQGGF